MMHDDAQRQGISSRKTVGETRRFWGYKDRVMLSWHKGIGEGLGIEAAAGAGTVTFLEVTKSNGILT